jgi:hypothetical protein
MRIGIVGAGHIGGNVARQAVKAGHEVMVSFSRDASSLDELARELHELASSGSPAQAVQFGELVVLSVPWSVIPEALEQVGDLSGKLVVDTTNQFGSGLMPADGQTAASFNAERMPGARYVKSFNTLTAGFQEQAAGRVAQERVVQWLCGDDADAKQLVARLIEDMGYAPVDLGGTADCEVMEAPRRAGSVYGEEWRLPQALEVVAAVRDGHPLPDTPQYLEPTA